MIEISRVLKHSFIRFLLVGVLNTLTGILVIIICRYMADWSYWMSTFTGNAFGAVVSFMLNRSYTFRSQAGYSTAALRFIAVVMICYTAAYGLGLRAAVSVMAVFDLWPSRAEDVAILLGIGIYTLLNYTGQKLFVFRKIPTRQ
jgi:putative flippase GtrA